MNVYAISAAFCPAAQLARSLKEYEKYREITPYRHIVVDCHYPINTEKNRSDIKIICETFGVELWDCGEDIGSAQSQNWVLERLSDVLEDDDVFINVDPDASCRTHGWDLKMMQVLKEDEKCVVITNNSPMVMGFIERRHQVMEHKVIAGHKVMIPDIPTPFNLSMWRINFLRALGGIPQAFPFYGEVEAPVFNMARINGYYHCYLEDTMEDEQGKLMHDADFERWKDLHARTDGPESFAGSFGEWLQTKELGNEERSKYFTVMPEGR